jgi:GxxExxY protein
LHYFLKVITMHELSENEISRHVYECAIEAHRALGGPGLLESVYEEALVWELEQRGLHVQRQRHTPIPYKGHFLATPLRLDLLVGGKVIVECKATTQYNSIYEVQTLTYLRLTRLCLGMVINFGERRVKDGIHRVVNHLPDDNQSSTIKINTQTVKLTQETQTAQKTQTGGQEYI